MSESRAAGAADPELVWTVQLVAEPAADGEEVRLESMAGLLRALPSDEATVSWQARRYSTRLSVRAPDVAAALQGALAVVQRARLQSGLPDWPVTSSVVGRAAG